MNIGALDKIANIQTRISEIEQKITGFSAIFQEELQNISKQTEARSAAEAVEPTQQTDYAALSALLNQNSSVNSLLVDSSDSSAAGTLFGSTEAQSIIEAYLKNQSGSKAGDISDVLGLTGQFGTSDFSTALLSSVLSGSNTDVKSAVETYLKDNKPSDDAEGIRDILGLTGQFGTSDFSTALLSGVLSGNHTNVKSAVEAYLKNSTQSQTASTGSDAPDMLGRSIDMQK